MNGMHLQPDTLGLPIAPGTPFRYVELDALPYGPGTHVVPHLIAVLDHSNGPYIEARTHTSRRVVVIQGTPSGMGFDADNGLLRVIRAALDGSPDDASAPSWRRWHDAIGARCSVPGCPHGLPMTDSANLDRRRQGETECLAHRVRTVEACTTCGAPDLLRTIGRNALLERGSCFSCDLWKGRARDMDPTKAVTAEGRYYSIGPGGGSQGGKGFGGHPWVVTFTDGRVIRTDDLWFGGDIPEAVRDLFPPNATVESVSNQPKGSTGGGA
jgi:hypothetical protein